MKKTDANRQFLPTYNFAISASESHRQQDSNMRVKITSVFESYALRTRECLLTTIQILNKIVFQFDVYTLNLKTD